MKILHVIPSVGPLRGGPSVVMQTMAKGLAKRGCEVHVATTDDNGPYRLSVPLNQPVANDAVTYWYFPKQTEFYSFSWPLSRWLARHVAEFDLVHIHALFSFPVIPSAYWAARYSIPYVVRPLGTLNHWGLANRRPWLKRASLRWIDRPALNAAAAVHYTSRQECEESSAVAPRSNPVVIPNPVEFSIDRATSSPAWLTARYPELAGRQTILFLSRLDPTKGIDLLLAAFAAMRRRGCAAALLLAGTGEEGFIRGLRNTARELGLGNDVIWAGFLEGEQKKAAMTHASVLVQPSYTENFGVAVAEAMACGLPVVVSDRVGIHYEISAAGAGLVVPCAAEPLASALETVLGDHELGSRLAANGLELSKTFTVDAVTGQLTALYESILARKGAAKWRK